MYVVRIEVNNHGPFKGHHSIDLEPSVYGVVGRHVLDQGRSNWLGKSWALNMVRYALYGAHTASSEDDIITHGESEMWVGILMDDGTQISRSRNTGSSSQLEYTPSGRKTATQKRAQELIDDYTKMTLADFDASCYIGQKQIARMVTASPADRTKIVNAWLELGPLQDAAGHASDHLRDLLKRKGTLELDGVGAMMPFVDFNPVQAAEDATTLEKKIDGMAELRRVLKDEIQVGLDWEREKLVADEFETLLVQGKEAAEAVKVLEADLNGLHPHALLEEVVQDAAVEVSTARALHSADETLARGEFDGQCPVMQGECPAPRAVRATKDQAKLRLPQHVENVDRLKIAYDEVKALKASRATVERDLAEYKRDLDDIRTDAQGCSAAADFIAENPDPIDVGKQQIAEEKYDTHIADLKVELKLLEVRIADFVVAEKVANQAGPALKLIDNDIRTAREAVAILGRGGAQKEIATSALAAIETMANGLLSQASIDLSLAVRWAREGKGLASHCDACGTPFGTSARVKLCPGCGANRGPKMVEKLELELSNTSGAAEDMCGLAFQLAASTWLRKKRGSDWSVVFIDEPFGALDETNARNLSAHLHTMIRGQFGFEQGFLVAHSAAIMGAMPRRVVISADATGSSLGVE